MLEQFAAIHEQATTISAAVVQAIQTASPVALRLDGLDMQITNAAERNDVLQPRRLCFQTASAAFADLQEKCATIQDDSRRLIGAEEARALEAQKQAIESAARQAKRRSAYLGETDRIQQEAERLLTTLENGFGENVDNYAHDEASLEVGCSVRTGALPRLIPTV